MIKCLLNTDINDLLEEFNLIQLEKLNLMNFDLDDDKGLEGNLNISHIIETPVYKKITNKTKFSNNSNTSSIKSNKFNEKFPKTHRKTPTQTFLDKSKKSEINFLTHDTAINNNHARNDKSKTKTFATNANKSVSRPKDSKFQRPLTSLGNKPKKEEVNPSPFNPSPFAQLQKLDRTEEFNELFSIFDNVFGKDLENFNEDLLNQTLNENDRNVLLKSLIFCIYSQKKRERGS